MSLPMFGYVCFYKTKRIEVRAPSSYAAQVQAARDLGLKTEGQRRAVTVMLAERPSGEPVTHSGAAL